MPWWFFIQRRVVLPAGLLTIRLSSDVSAEPLRIALRGDWMSVQMAAAAYAGTSHSGAMRMVAFSSSYNEVVVTPRCCFVRRVVGLAGYLLTYLRLHSPGSG